MTGASASSTSTESKPLDITMVLDTSGSMGEQFTDSGELYTPVYGNVSDMYQSSEQYYVKNGNDYVQVKRDWLSGLFSDTKKFYTGDWFFGRTDRYPKSSASDSQHDQFYRSTKKIDALKRAVTNFATQTAKQNDTISDAAKQHKISIITFASDSSVKSDFTAYTSTGQSLQDLNDLVNGLSASGGTHSEKGMAAAQREFNQNGRSDAQKVVIFFTDGEPGDYGFEGGVANQTVQAVKQLKEQGALVFSVGVFDGANPSDTTGQFNAYMNAVSSNYPNATSYTSLGQGSNAGYYKTAQNADQLNEIFEEIISTLTKEIAYTGVTIKDTLSDNVELASSVAADGTVSGATITASDGSAVPSNWKLRKQANGQLVLDMGKDADGKDFRLAKGVTYTVSFKASPLRRVRERCHNGQC